MSADGYRRKMDYLRAQIKILERSVIEGECSRVDELYLEDKTELGDGYKAGEYGGVS